MMDLFRELRFAFRSVVRRPALAVAAVATLAIGIGANTAVFSLAWSALWRPLPVAEPDRLVGLYRKVPAIENYNRFSYPNYLDTRDRSRSFTGLAAYYFVPLSLSVADTERVPGKLVTDNYFSVLGVAMAMGRGFTEAEGQPAGSSPVAVISDGLWKRHFGADPGVLGRTVRLSGTPFTIVGVTPPDFRGTETGQVPDIYVPVLMQTTVLPGFNMIEPRDVGWLRVVGRLRPGLDVTAAQRELESIGTDLKREYPGPNEAFGIAVVPDFSVHPDMRGSVAASAMLLLAVVGAVLLIVCANLANLMLSRAADRAREIGVRMAIGAGRWQVARQLLYESLILAALGGALGVGLAAWITDTVAQRTQPQLFAGVSISDLRVVAFSLAVSLASGLLFGSAPALQAMRTDVMATIKGMSASASVRSRLRQSLVAIQVALSVLLLIGASLFGRSLAAMQSIDPGFDAAVLSSLSVDLSQQGYDRTAGREFQARALEAVKRIPGVVSATIADAQPLTSDRDAQIPIEGYTPPGGMRGAVVNFANIGPDYFDTLGIRLVSGRNFDAADRDGAPAVAIVNETFARQFWPGRDPIGLTLGAQPARVIGVAEDSKYVSLAETARPFVYFSLNQGYRSPVSLIVRSVPGVQGVLEGMRREIRELDRDLPVFDVRPMAAVVESSGESQRMLARSLLGFGGIALVLAAVGVYGVVAFLVGRRKREIGVRIALGASPRSTVLMVLRHELAVIGIGVILGTALAAAAANLFRTLLFGIVPYDPVSFAVAPVAVSVVAVAASLIPARQASQTDPSRLLRPE